MKIFSGIAVSIIFLAVIITFVAGLITHLIACVAAKARLFLIAGALIPPLAVVHGWSVWLGFDWLH